MAAAEVSQVHRDRWGGRKGSLVCGKRGGGGGEGNEWSFQSGARRFKEDSYMKKLFL